MIAEAEGLGVADGLGVVDGFEVGFGVDFEVVLSA